MTVRSTSQFVISVALSAGLWGCSDPAAEQRAQAQQKLTEIASKIAFAGAHLTGSEDDADKVKKKLNDALASLNAVTVTEDGLAASKALLTADGHRALAEVALAQAAEQDATLAVERAKIRNASRSILALASIQQGQGTLTTKPMREELQEAAANASASTDELLRGINELNQPISTLSDQKAADTQQIEHLRLQAQQLLREATERGPADGLSTFEEAMSVLSQSDKLEIAMYTRDIELENSLRPAHNHAMTKVEGHRSVLSNIEQTTQTFDTFDTAQSAARSETDQQLAARGAEIEKALATISERTTAEIQPKYDLALENLEKAQRQAQQAAGKLKGGDATTANMQVAQIQLARGRVHAAAARNAADVFRPLALAARVPQAASFNTAAKGLLETATSELDDARTAFTEAKETLAKISAGGANADLVASLTEHVDSAIANLAAPSAEVAPLPTEVDTQPVLTVKGGDAEPADDAGPTGPAPSSGGAQTPEALIERINALAGDDVPAAEKADGMTELMYAESADGKTLITTFTSVTRASFELVDAMTVKFGRDETHAALSAPGANMALDFPTISPEDITERTDRMVTLKSALSKGSGDSMKLRKLGERWFIDVDDVARQAGPGLAMLTGLSAPLTSALNDTSKRVRAGEFEKPQDVLKALNAAVAEAMGMPAGMGEGGDGTDGASDPAGESDE